MQQPPVSGVSQGQWSTQNSANWLFVPFLLPPHKDRVGNRALWEAGRLLDQTDSSGSTSERFIFLRVILEALYRSVSLPSGVHQTACLYTAKKDERNSVMEDMK